MNTITRKFQLTLLFIFSIFISFGQNITPAKAYVQFDGKSRASLDVVVDAEPKALKKAWRDFLKEHYDFKLSGIGLFSNKDILTAEEVVVPSISSDAMDFYTKIVSEQDGTRMSVFAAHGYDIYVNEEEYPKEFAKMKHMMSDFLDQYITQMYADRIEVLEKDLDDLVGEEADLKKSIQSNKEEIKSLEKEIDAKKVKVKEEELELETIDKKVTKERDELKVLKSKLKAVQ